MKNGLIFNSNKCRTRQLETSFYGAVFVFQGMKPNLSKVQALQDLPTPNNEMKLFFFMPHQLFTTFHPWIIEQDH